MGFLDRLLGRDPAPMNTSPAGGYAEPPGPRGTSGAVPSPARTEDQAVARYRYLLRTASPEQLEQIHAEAFARLTPDQREQLLRELGSSLPAGEQVRSDSPQDLARAATRGEMRQPGYLQSTLSRGSFAGGMGGTIMGSMLGTVAGFVIGSAIADALFDGYAESPEAAEAGDPGLAAEGGDSGSDAGSDAGDAGTDGADFGGGDLGAGDFGGGDFGGGFDGGF
jgi:hypothetical protein